MPPLAFISYSHKDEAWKDDLLPSLKLLQHLDVLEPWSDRGIDAGEKWYDEIRAKMLKARVVILLLSRSFLESDFCIKEEIPYLLERAEADRSLILVPILIHPCGWKRIPFLKDRQLLPRDGRTVSEHFTTQDARDRLFTEIADFIADTLDEQKNGPAILRKWPRDRYDIERLPGAGSELFGRKDDLIWLDAQWHSRTIGVASLVAGGGVGKSTVVGRWLEGLAHNDWDGAKRVYGWSFYSQGTNDRVTSADTFIRAALAWFGDDDPDAGSPWDKGERLAGLVRREKSLLVLDGLEPLQWGQGIRGQIKDPALATLVAELARDNPGLCVITTREPVADLADFRDRSAERDLHQISAQAGRALLRVRGARGSDKTLEAVSTAFGNHALAVSLLSAWLEDTPDRPDLALAIPDLPSVPVDKGRHPRRVLAAFAGRLGEGADRQVLRLLGLFDRPATPPELVALRAAPPIPGLTDRLPPMLDAGAWEHSLERLRRWRLIAPASHHAPGEIDAHPLVREHFAAELHDHHPDAARAGHERLYRYWCAVPQQHLPDTLNDLAPLYLAIPHGCAAGRHQEVLDEVFYRRVRRGNTFYSVKRLGAWGADLAALAAFFDLPWTTPVPTLHDNDRAFVLCDTAAALQTLGRLVEALTPRIAGLEMRIRQNSWANAARSSNSLTELLAALGRLGEAEATAREGMELADRSGDESLRLIPHAYLAYLLLQRGHLDEAAKLFAEIEAIQRQGQPKYPYLYSVNGYQYCDLLLAIGNFNDVQERTDESFLWHASGSSLLTIALDHLSRGRGEAAAVAEEAGNPTSAENWLDQAVTHLRTAGTLPFQPLGFLARAGFLRQQKRFDEARHDLAETRRIAGRGGMRLHLIDTDLEEARLEMALGNPAAARPLIERARTGIAETGYHRRDGELDALDRDLALSLRGVTAGT
jgi:tetratricopeptide (TPR) repeat protein